MLISSQSGQTGAFFFGGVPIGERQFQSNQTTEWAENK